LLIIISSVQSVPVHAASRLISTPSGPPIASMKEMPGCNPIAPIAVNQWQLAR
jgi:hypothetical protein